MNRSTPFKLFLCLPALLPSLAAAHPGHYHPPGEEDEFDHVSANWLHLHGWLEMLLAAVLLISFLVFRYDENCKVRLGAVLAFGSSLALLATF